MAFDPTTAQPVSSGGFDPSTAAPVSDQPTAPMSGGGASGSWTDDPVLQRQEEIKQEMQDSGALPHGREPGTYDSRIASGGPANLDVRPGIAGAIEMAGSTVGGLLGATAGVEGGPPGMVVGGGAGSAFGNYEAQKLNQSLGLRDMIDKGDVVASGIGGAFGGVSGNMAKTGVMAIIKQGAVQGLGGATAAAGRSLVDTGNMGTVKDAAWASILPALGGSFAEHMQQANPEIAAARTAAEAKIAPRAATLAAAQKEGFVVEPSQTNPSLVNKTVESMAGGPSIRQAATHVNQDVADNIARRILDPSNPDTELTSQVAQAVRQRAYDVGYRPVASAGSVPVDTQYVQDLRGIYNRFQGAARSFPDAVNNDVENLIKGVSVRSFDAGDAIQMAQQLRNAASDSFAQGKSQLGIAQRQASKAIEDQLERHLSAVAAGTVTLPQPGTVLPPSIGTPQSRIQAATMLQNFRDARTLMAQSHDIEDAIREGGGSIVQSRLAAKAEAGKPLSGGLDTIGKFANNFPTVTREGAKTPVPGTTVTGNFARVVQGAGLATAAGTATHSPAAAALAGAAGITLPSVRGLVRSLVLSGPYQRLMTKIPVTVEANPDLGALIIRQGGQAAGTQTTAPDAVPATSSP